MGKSIDFRALRIPDFSRCYPVKWFFLQIEEATFDEIDFTQKHCHFDRFDGIFLVPKKPATYDWFSDLTWTILWHRSWPSCRWWQKWSWPVFRSRTPSNLQSRVDLSVEFPHEPLLNHGRLCMAGRGRTGWTHVSSSRWSKGGRR